MVVWIKLALGLLMVGSIMLIVDCGLGIWLKVKKHRLEFDSDDPA